MRLYRQGDEGEAVRDIQDRLGALGFDTEDDPTGSFGESTYRAVSAFQAKRGLWADGIVGPDTWRALVSAGYTLGSRILYHRVPMMAGDDVADLQRQLNSLGFDSGNVDGIFGPDTLRGLLAFQSNRGLAEDGLAGTEVIAELALMSRATAKHGREAVRGRQWLENILQPLAASYRFAAVLSRCAGHQSQFGDHLGTGQTVLGQTPVGLKRKEPAQGIRAENAVDVSGVETERVELTLQIRHVVTGHHGDTVIEDPAPERVAGADQGSPCIGTNDAVRP